MTHTNQNMSENHLLNVPFLALNPENALLNEDEFKEEEFHSDAIEELSKQKQNRSNRTNYNSTFEKSLLLSNGRNTPLMPPQAEEPAINDIVFVSPFNSPNNTLYNPIHSNTVSTSSNASTDTTKNILTNKELPSNNQTEANLNRTTQLNRHLEDILYTIATLNQQDKKNTNTQKEKNSSTKRNRVQLELRTLGQRAPIPVISKNISGNRFIHDTDTLLNYCLKWCRDIYPHQTAFRAIHNTGTMLLVLPNGQIHFIQFIYGRDIPSTQQKAFQYLIAPQPIHIFKNFNMFANWIKEKLR